MDRNYIRHYLFAHIIFLISFSVNAASNLYNWTFEANNATQFHISGKTIYKNQSYERSTTIDLTNTNQKSLFMSTVKNRLFQTNDGFNTTSVTKLHSDLINEGWKIDQKAKTIYKDVYPNRVCTFFNSIGELVDFTATGIAKFQCPKDAIDALSRVNAAQSQPKRSYTWNGWESEAINYSDDIVSARYMFIENKIKYYEILSLERYSVHDEQVLPNRVFMTESQLFDFIQLKDNVDYVNVYRAYTNYEKLNNKAYLYITDLFMPFEPADTDIQLPDNNGNTGDTGNTGNSGNTGNTGNNDQSTFCSYATTVCNFIDWFKETIEPAQDENIQVKDTGIETHNHYWTEYFNVTPSCPSPYTIDTIIDLKFTQERFHYEFDYTNICWWAEQLRKFFLFATYCGCAFIIGGIRNG